MDVILGYGGRSEAQVRVEDWWRRRVGGSGEIR